MNKSLVLGLPNGKACHFTSTAMPTVARCLRWETFKCGQYSHAGFELQVDDTVIDIGARVDLIDHGLARARGVALMLAARAGR
jgi:hypothetical protein